MYKCIIHSWFFCIVSICLPKEVDGVINVLVRRGMGKGEDFVSNKHSWMVVAESSNYIHPILWLICNCIRKDSLIGRKYSFIAFHVLVNCEVFYCTIDSQHDLWYVHTLEVIPFLMNYCYMLFQICWGKESNFADLTDVALDLVMNSFHMSA